MGDGQETTGDCIKQGLGRGKGREKKDKKACGVNLQAFFALNRNEGFILLIKILINQLVYRTCKEFKRKIH